MLVVSRKADQSIVIDVQGTPIYVHVLRTKRGATSVGIDAPREWGIRRTELPAYLGGSPDLDLQDLCDEIQEAGAGFDASTT